MSTQPNKINRILDDDETVLVEWSTGQPRPDDETESILQSLCEAYQGDGYTYYKEIPVQASKVDPYLKMRGVE